MNSAILICTPNELGGIKTVGVDYTNFSKSDGQTGVKNNAPPPPPGGGGQKKNYILDAFLILHKAITLLFLHLILMTVCKIVLNQAKFFCMSCLTGVKPTSFIYIMKKIDLVIRAMTYTPYL